MAYANHEINALISIDPEKAKDLILSALKKAKMHREEAAANLDCNYGTLLRWIVRLSMQREIARLTKAAKKEGWYHGRKGGRPTGTTIANGAARRGSRRATPG